MEINSGTGNLTTLSQVSELINSDLDEFLMNELKNNPLPNDEMINIPEDWKLSLSGEEQISEQVEQREVVANNPTGTYPCMDEYKGPLDFELFLDGSKSAKKSWVYSNILEKVFLDMEKVLELQFKINKSIPGLRVRALPVYNMADFRSLPVTRCNVHSIRFDPHSLAHKEKGTCLCHFYHWVGHIIRSNHDDACYEYDSLSERHSVTVPLDQFQPDSDTVTIPYYFTCKTSCMSGMNRKPIDVIFTLETSDGEVIGRQSLSFKICSCPKRDQQREETDDKVTREDAKRLGMDVAPSSVKYKRKSITSSATVEGKKIKTEKNPTDSTTNITPPHPMILAALNELKNKMVQIENKLHELTKAVSSLPVDVFIED